jgi:hypothetical protein
MRLSVARDQNPSKKRSDDVESELSIARHHRENSRWMQFGFFQQNRPKRPLAVGESRPSEALCGSGGDIGDRATPPVGSSHPAAAAIAAAEPAEEGLHRGPIRFSRRCAECFLASTACDFEDYA